jgi:hypothetical protein
MLTAGAKMVNDGSHEPPDEFIMTIRWGMALKQHLMHVCCPRLKWLQTHELKSSPMETCGPMLTFGILAPADH